MDHIGSNWIKLDQIGSYWIKLDQFGLIWTKMIQIGSNWSCKSMVLTIMTWSLKAIHDLDMVLISF